MKQFEATVSALCYSMLLARCAGDHDRDFPHNRVVRFVLDQHRRMPDFLRFPFMAATIVFGWSSVLRYGQPFHRLPHSTRWRHVEAWRALPLGVCKDLIKFYESFVLFCAYSTRTQPDDPAAGKAV